MYPLVNLNVKDLVETTLEFFSLRSPSTSSVINLPDPRGRQSPEIPDNAVAERSSDGPSLGGSPGSVEEDLESYAGTESELDSSPTKEIARLRGELKLLREKHIALQNTFRDTQQQVRQKDAQIEQLREKNRKLESDCQEAQRHAEDQKLEVKSLEKFLNKTDRWAGSDLVQNVKDMNSEILQFSAAASEGVATERRTVSQSNPGRRRALERIAARFGSKMRHCLEKRDHGQDPTILQYALQACISQSISHALSSFCYGSSGKLEAHLTKVYQHMHTTEPQPTAARWRALTHSHMRTMTPNIDELGINEVTETCTRGIANVLAAAGFGEVEEILQKVQSKYKTQLRRIAESASKFAIVIREGTMSTDFVAAFVESARDFRAASMENLYEGYGPSQGRVLCTVAMGLQCSTNRGRDGKDFSEHTIERRILLKPKVVLESVVEILDR